MMKRSDMHFDLYPIEQRYDELLEAYECLKDENDEESWDVGYSIGREEGYDEGFNDGHATGLEEKENL